MRGWTKHWVILGLCLSLGGLACDDSEQEAEGAEAAGPLLGALELPVSMKRPDSAPTNAVTIEVSPSEARVAGKSVLTLAGGQVGVGDMQGDAVPKLVEAIKGVGQSSAALEVHASLPYRTLVQILNAAQEAGVKKVAFKVRGNGGPEEQGYLAMPFSVGPHTSSETAAPGLTKRPWSDFTDVWEDVESGCRNSDSGACAYKPETIADGGELKTVLYAAGDGVNVNYYRIGAAPEPAAKKVEKLEGVPEDPQAEPEEPATEALFQFRAREAVKDDSAVTATLAPVCKGRACELVMQAEAKTMSARVISLLGVAVPPGGSLGQIRFEFP